MIRTIPILASGMLCLLVGCVQRPFDRKRARLPLYDLPQAHQYDHPPDPTEYGKGADPNPQVGRASSSHRHRDLIARQLEASRNYATGVAQPPNRQVDSFEEGPYGNFPGRAAGFTQPPATSARVPAPRYGPDEESRSYASIDDAPGVTLLPPQVANLERRAAELRRLDDRHDLRVPKQRQEHETGSFGLARVECLLRNAFARSATGRARESRLPQFCRIGIAAAQHRPRSRTHHHEAAA